MAHALEGDLGITLADRLIAGLPVIDGEADAEFPSTALGRAGRPGRVDRFETDRLGGGRISTDVFSLQSDAGAFVLKRFVPEPWRVKLFGPRCASDCATAWPSSRSAGDSTRSDFRSGRPESSS